MSGLDCQRLLEGVDAVLGLGDDLHVGLAVDEKAQAATDDAVVVGDQDLHFAPMVSSIVVPSLGAEYKARLPPTSSARSRMPDSPRPPTRPRGRPLRPELPGPGSKPVPVVGDAQDRAAHERELDADVAGVGVLGDVGEALLRDAVDHELLLVGQRRHRAVAREAGVDPGALREVLDLRRERRDQAVVVERGRAQLAREVQELLHRLVGEALGLLQLGAQRVRRVHRGRLEAQQDAGERLVDLVVEVLGDPRALLLLAAQHGAAGLAALLLDAGQHVVEARGQLLHLAGGPARRIRAHAGGVEVDAVHRAHEAVHRLEAVADQQRVEQHGAEHRQREQQQALGLVASLSRSRATTAAMIAVAPTSSELTARTCVSKVRVRIRCSYRPSVQRPLWGWRPVMWHPVLHPGTRAILSEALKPDLERVIS